MGPYIPGYNIFRVIINERAYLGLTTRILIDRKTFNGDRFVIATSYETRPAICKTILLIHHEGKNEREREREDCLAVVVARAFDRAMFFLRRNVLRSIARNGPSASANKKRQA